MRMPPWRISSYVNSIQHYKPPKAMKHTLKLTALAAALMLAACGNNNSSTTTTSTDSNVDTQPVGTPAPDQHPMGDSGMNNGSGGSSMNNQNMSDQDFVTRASAMNIAEINAHKS